MLLGGRLILGTNARRFGVHFLHRRAGFQRVKPAFAIGMLVQIEIIGFPALGPAIAGNIGDGIVIGEPFGFFQLTI